jgi:Alpha-L-arabinofuranosidase B, catalytic
MLRWLLVWLALAAPAFAQSNGSLLGLNIGAPPVSSASTYTGPLDTVSGATVCVSLRSCSASYATGSNKSVNIRRASDNETCDVLITSAGNLGLTTNCSGADGGKTPTVFCSSTTCFAAEGYDQSGNGHNLTQATAGSQLPFLPGSCSLGSFPCFQQNGSALTMAGTIPALTTPYSASLTYIRTNSAATNRQTLADSAGNNELESGGASNQVQASQASSVFTATASDSAWHSIQTVLNGGSSGINVDGIFTAGSTGARTSGTTLTFGSNNDADETEFIVYPFALNSTQYGALCHNIYTYWGTSTSC